MKIEDMFKNLDPSMLKKAITSMNKMNINLSAEDIKHIENTIQSGNTAPLAQKLKNLKPEDLKRELLNNPSLLKQLQGNKDALDGLNSILKNNRY